MTNSSKKRDFESLFLRALHDWPGEVNFGVLQRHDPLDERYTIEGLYFLCDKIAEPYLGSIDEILMRNLHDAIYIVLHSAAPYCSDIKVSQLRKETVQSHFERMLAPASISKKNGWTDYDRELVKIYFKETQKAAKRKLNVTIKTAKTATEKFRVGEMYYWGDGVKKSYVNAVKWYRKSANDGSKNAKSKLGMMYERGFGVKQSYKEAYFWYRSGTKTAFDDPIVTKHLTAKQIAAVEQRVQNWNKRKK